MGYADIGVHGSKDIPTSNIDALANGGIRFTDAYVTGPELSPCHPHGGNIMTLPHELPHNGSGGCAFVSSHLHRQHDQIVVTSEH